MRQGNYQTLEQLRAAIGERVNQPNPDSDRSHFTVAQLEAIARELNDGADPAPADERRQDYRVWIADTIGIHYDPDRIASYECPYRREEVEAITDALQIR